MSDPTQNTWNITLNSPWFEYVQNGKKTFEGRCFWKQVLNYKINDILVISHHTDKEKPSYNVKIINIHKFQNFAEALENTPIDKVLPGIASIADGIEIYKKYYRLETQNDNGVCLIELLLC
jgi:ASC-1-like (ASCH) protein